MRLPGRGPPRTSAGIGGRPGLGVGCRPRGSRAEGQHSTRGRAGPWRSLAAAALDWKQPGDWRKTHGTFLGKDTPGGDGWDEIGRASCRERVEMSVVGGSLKKKKRDKW